MIAQIDHHVNKVLKTNKTIAKIFEKQKFINIKRQRKNFRHILTKPSFKENRNLKLQNAKINDVASAPIFVKDIILVLVKKQFTINNSMSY